MLVDSTFWWAHCAVKHSINGVGKSWLILHLYLLLLLPSTNPIRCSYGQPWNQDFGEYVQCWLKRTLMPTHVMSEYWKNFHPLIMNLMRSALDFFRADWYSCWFALMVMEVVLDEDADEEGEVQVEELGCRWRRLSRPCCCSCCWAAESISIAESHDFNGFLGSGTSLLARGFWTMWG